ncbi:hypothetical protein [Hymenobacter sp.]|uniref:hypothetical protein n=1 Tax=Hymenobacter sp. TaxID=1898978 RepID=UPI002ED97EBD
MSDAAPLALPADVAHPTGFLHTLLTMSLTAVAVLRPLYAEGNETICDFAWVSLNPAGQRLLAQPDCPTESLLTLFPTAQTGCLLSTARPLPRVRCNATKPATGPMGGMGTS